MPVELPIDPEKLKQKSFTNRFWGSEPRHNYFARAKNLVLQGGIDRSMIAKIDEEYDGNLAEDFKHQWVELLNEISYWLAIDGKIDGQERQFLREYVSVFEISKPIAERAYRDGARRAYYELAESLLADERLTDAEVTQLENLAKTLGLPAEVKSQAIGEQASMLLQEQLNEILEDGMISDKEWEQFERTRRNLRVGMQVGEGDRLVIEAARDRWRARFGEIQPVELLSAYRLKASEIPYFQGYANWYESRSIKGSQVLKLIASGELVLTSERVLFRGSQGDNKALAWTSIHAITDYGSNRFELEKERGKSPVIEILRCHDGRDGAAACLAARLLEQTM